VARATSDDLTGAALEIAGRADPALGAAPRPAERN
jgi:hypothetical protein